MAPVIPFLSDDPAQLRATVRAIAASGAASVTPLVLHLRPGARATVRHSAGSVKPTETEMPTSVTSEACTRRSRSRRISVPFVRIEKGFAWSRRAEMIPGIRP